MAQSKFAQYVLDLLSPYGNITARAMFGGYGIYKGGVIIALIVDDELYFKTDDSTIKTYKAHGSEPFTYNHKGKTVRMSYWKVPTNIMEDHDLLGEWLNVSWQISATSKQKKKPQAKPKKQALSTIISN